MSSRELKKWCVLDSEGHRTLQHAVDVLGVSARACDRILRVALTLADLEGVSAMQTHHVMEALSFRSIEDQSTQ